MRGPGLAGVIDADSGEAMLFGREPDPAQGAGGGCGRARAVRHAGLLARPALGDERQREAALITFVVAASGVTIAGLGAPLWALLAGVAVSGLQQQRWRLARA